MQKVTPNPDRTIRSVCASMKMEGFSAGLIPREINEFDPYMRVLFVIVSIPPAIGCILSVIPTWKYCLDDKEHERILNELNLRRAKLDQ